jgi:hypothetical protein
MLPEADVEVRVEQAGAADEDRCGVAWEWSAQRLTGAGHCQNPPQSHRDRVDLPQLPRQCSPLFLSSNYKNPQ